MAQTETDHGNSVITDHDNGVITDHDNGVITDHDNGVITDQDNGVITDHGIGVIVIINKHMDAKPTHYTTIISIITKLCSQHNIISHSNTGFGFNNNCWHTFLQ